MLSCYLPIPLLLLLHWSFKYLSTVNLLLWCHLSSNLSLIPLVPNLLPLLTPNPDLLLPPLLVLNSLSYLSFNLHHFYSYLFLKKLKLYKVIVVSFSSIPRLVSSFVSICTCGVSIFLPRVVSSFAWAFCYLLLLASLFSWTGTRLFLHS